MRRFQMIAVVFLIVLIAVALPRTAAAKVRLDSICTISGMHEVHLVGIGIVTGLNGTGDSSKHEVMHRRFGQILRLMNAPARKIDELKNVKNVALVKVYAVIPRHGIRYGQKLDCYVSSALDAPSLRGGILWPTAMLESLPGKRPRNGKRSVEAFGRAAGRIVIEDPKSQTVGRIPVGVQMTRDVINKFVSRNGYITLLVNPNLSSAYTANEVARAINEEFSVESTTSLAKATDANSVRVMIPPSYLKSPYEFVGLVMSVGVEQPHVQARVVVNAKTNTIIVTGEVEVSPVIVSIAGIQIDTQGTTAGGGGRDSFAAITDRRNPQSTKSLKDLIEAFRDLKVPPEDIIKVLRELHRAGKLYAEFIEK